MTACSRDPSGIVASRNGVDMPIRRSEVRSTRSTRSASSPGATIVVSSLRPRRTTNTRPGSLIRISSASGSSSQRCSGPNPATRSSTSRTTASGSTIGGSAEVSDRSE
jgi:hypothetical protein